MSNHPTPRPSFPPRLIRPDNPLSPRTRVGSPNSDFDFDVGAEVSSSADELFSDGKIRTAPLKKSYSDPNPNPIPVSEKGGGKRSLWRFGRSASHNCAGSGMMMKIKFPRSYSAGSGSGANPNPELQVQSGARLNAKRKDAKSSRKSCYFEKNGGNNAKSLRKSCYFEKNGGNNAKSSLPLFPKERGLIGFLMCNCVGGGNIHRGIESYRSP